jgi:hypothetical protein
MNHIISPPNDQRKSPGADPGSQLKLPIDGPKSTPRPRKWQRILLMFVEGKTLNRFEAERVGDHALHSTVSGIQSRGVTILRREETVAGFMGAPTRVMRYWLCEASRGRALELLGKTPPTSAAPASREAR